MSDPFIAIYAQFMAANAADEAIPDGEHPSDRVAAMLYERIQRGQVEQAKRLANLKAHAALHGITLHVTDSDTGRPVYVLSEYAYTRQMETLEAVAEWLTRRTGITA